MTISSLADECGALVRCVITETISLGDAKGGPIAARRDHSALLTSSGRKQEAADGNGHRALTVSLRPGKSDQRAPGFLLS